MSVFTVYGTLRLRREPEDERVEFWLDVPNRLGGPAWLDATARDMLERAAAGVTGRVPAMTRLRAVHAALQEWFGRDGVTITGVDYGEGVEEPDMSVGLVPGKIH